MTNGSDRLLSTVILKFRKQMAILTITQRHEIKCIFGPIRLGGSQLVGVVSHVGAAVPACGLPPGGSERHDELCSHWTEQGLLLEKAKPHPAHRLSVPAPTTPPQGRACLQPC